MRFLDTCFSQNPSSIVLEQDTSLERRFGRYWLFKIGPVTFLRTSLLGHDNFEMMVKL